MRELIINNNLPETINFVQLQNEIKNINSEIRILYKPTIRWTMPDNNILKSKAEITLKNIPDQVQDSTLITVIQNHVAIIPNDSNKSYRQLRRDLIRYVSENYADMTTSQLKLAAENFAVPANVRDIFFTLDEQIQLGLIFNEKATDDRQTRANKAIVELMNRLQYSETCEIITDLTDSGNYIWKYISLGVEGTVEGDVDGLFDYFTSTPGTIFENNGFLEKSFIPRGGITIQQLSDIIMGILKLN